MIEIKILTASSNKLKDSNSICQSITSSNRFNILNDISDNNVSDCDNNVSGYDNIYKISYTYDGQLIGNIDDIIWGSKLNNKLERWSDYV